MDRLHANLPTNGVTWSRAEVLHGPERRRRWTLDQKSLIVAEAFAPGVVTSSVARRHGVHPNQLYAWRRELRAAVGDGWNSPVFAPVVVAQVEPALPPGRRPKEPSSTIEVEIAGAVVRVTRECDLELLTALARALKAAA
jgi:transposase